MVSSWLRTSLRRMMPPRMLASASTLCGSTRRSRPIAGSVYAENRRQKLLVFPDDPKLEVGDHAGSEPHGDLVLTEGLDRLIELDRAVVDIDSRALELLGDVLVGDRAEQLLVLADHALELQRHDVDARGDDGGARALLGDLALDQRLLVVEAVLVAHGGADREAARHQVVAAVPRTHRDQLARLAEVLNVLREDDLHRHGSIPRARDRQEREHARAADRGRDDALLPRARSADPARDHLAAVGDEPAEGLRVLVVD